MLKTSLKSNLKQNKSRVFFFFLKLNPKKKEKKIHVEENSEVEEYEIEFFFPLQSTYIILQMTV